MQNAVKSQATFEETGVILGRSELGFAVGTASGQYEAERAVSCLVEPEVGDQVLLAVPPKGALFVIAVLRRTHEGALEIATDRDLSFRTPGALTMSAAERVEVTSAVVKTTATRIETTSVEASWSFEKLELVAGLVHANAKHLKAVLLACDTVLERVSQHVKRSYKVVEELELTRAKDVDLRVEKCLSMRSQNTLMDAEQIVKVQAEQVHLG
jgi:hypothetical protein